MLQRNEVLDFIANSSFRSTANTARYIFNQFEKKYKIDYSDFLRTLEKLWRDGYLEKEQKPNQETTYLLIYEGKGFANESGNSGDLGSQNNIRSKKAAGRGKALIVFIIIFIVALILWLFTR